MSLTFPLSLYTPANLSSITPSSPFDHQYHNNELSSLANLSGPADQVGASCSSAEIGDDKSNYWAPQVSHTTEYTMAYE